MDFQNIIHAVLIVGITGLIFGFLLAFASVVFKVDKDEREEKIINELPGANCGACGYAGCSAYADAIVTKGAAINLCSVGKKAVVEKISAIMNVKAQDIEEKVARVMCGGTCDVARDKFEYRGISDCVAASKFAGGAKECPNGCLGLGSCISVCKFDAISIIDGVAVIDEEKCQACGMCLKKCPKNLICFVPKKNKVWVHCSNNEKGVKTRQYCSAGCIGCKMCEKICPVGAIRVENNFAKIEYTICINCGECAKKCPKNAISSVVSDTNFEEIVN